MKDTSCFPPAGCKHGFWGLSAAGIAAAVIRSAVLKASVTIKTWYCTDGIGFAHLVLYYCFSGNLA